MTETKEKPADQLSRLTPEAARKAAEWGPIADDLRRQADKINEEGPEMERRFAARKAAQEASQSPPAPPAPPIDLGGNAGDNGGMEARVAKLEAAMEFVRSDIADIKQLLRGHDGKFDSMRNRAERDFRILFGAIIAVALGLAGLMAKGFHWL